MSEFLGSLEKLLAEHYAPDRLRAMENGPQAADDAMAAIEQSGFVDILKSEADGGAGQSLLDVEPLLRAIGIHAAPTDIALAMLKRRGDSPPSRPLLAVVYAVLISGALDKLLSLCIDHVTARQQFGKPIGKQQAIQHQLAQLAEQVVLVRVAAQYGCAAGFDVDEARAAVAKYTASAAVPLATSVAHAVHGAIGITAEYDLQLWVKRLYAWRATAGSESYWAGRMGAARIADAAPASSEFVRGI